MRRHITYQLLKSSNAKRHIDCGDLSDVAANSPGFADESDCDIACTGDPIHLCGGGERLQVRVYRLVVLRHRLNDATLVLRVERYDERLAHSRQYRTI